MRKVKDVRTETTDILVAADVTSLYTVIDHNEGIQACEEALEGRSEAEKKRSPTEFITKLIRIILSSNCFIFAGRLFRQILGTAMGTPMAPSYANLFMSKIETKILNGYEKKTGLRPKFWFRFLDDIIFLWGHGEESLHDFLEYMQDFGRKENMKTQLKFTFEIGSEVSFLDTKVKVDKGSIKTDLFSKPTAAHLYLRSDSCHPVSCKKGLIKGEMLRVRRICSSDSDFLKQSEIMRTHFLKRGFNNDSINAATKEVKEIPRDTLLEYKEKRKNSRIPFVLQYHPRMRGVSHVLKKHFSILTSSERLKKAFLEPPMVAFRRLPSLRDILVHTGTNRKEITESNSRCKDKRCKTCPNLMEAGTCTINGRNHKTLHGGSCNTTNLIYGLRCKQCDTWYVGETGNRLRDRINGHRDKAKIFKKKGEQTCDDKSDNGATIHFGGKDHEFDKDVGIHILDHGEWTQEERREKEDYYICKYKTLQPEGMNQKIGKLGSFYERI